MVKGRLLRFILVLTIVGGLAREVYSQDASELRYAVYIYETHQMISRRAGELIDFD